MIEELVIAAAAAAPFVEAARRARKTRHPLMLQWGRFVNRREGIQDHDIWANESPVVEFEDFKWWIRIKPNPGINLPVIGYWSKANGRRR